MMVVDIEDSSQPLSTNQRELVGDMYHGSLRCKQTPAVKKNVAGNMLVIGLERKLYGGYQTVT